MHLIIVTLSRKKTSLPWWFLSNYSIIGSRKALDSLTVTDIQWKIQIRKGKITELAYRNQCWRVKTRSIVSQSYPHKFTLLVENLQPSQQMKLRINFKIYTCFVTTSHVITKLLVCSPQGPNYEHQTAKQSSSFPFFANQSNNSATITTKEEKQDLLVLIHVTYERNFRWPINQHWKVCQKTPSFIVSIGSQNLSIGVNNLTN